MEVAVEWVEELDSRDGGATICSGRLWNLWPGEPELVFDFHSPVYGVHPYKRLCLSADFRCARVLLNESLLADWVPIDPLQYPAAELLMTNYLASGLGVEVHGCGFIDTETGGHLLLGHSGAGKSTTARLWERLRRPEILSDDRIILRIHNGELWMYGTPWHGEAAFASPGKAKLNRILILQHGRENQISELSKPCAVGEMFARCFPPFHSAIGLENTLEFLTRVAELVPCYEFHFVPDDSAVETVLRLQ
jgi:hypothetical protein